MTHASQVSSWVYLSTTVLIRPDNSEESKSGNCFANRANVHFAVQLVVQLYRDAALVDARDFSKRASVLILTPYKGQRRVYDLLLKQLTEAEVPKTLVEVRTVDDSPSHEADVVILDLVRTVKKGFIREAPRMNAATTRARLGQFVIGPGKKTPLEWPLNHLVAFLEERSAVINLRGRCRWYLMCQNCCQPGHLATDCRLSRSVSDVLNPPRVNFSDSKRSKKNSTTREEAFPKPDKHKDAMRQVFREAMRGLREVKKGQDAKEDVETDEQDQAGEDGADNDGTADGIQRDILNPPRVNFPDSKGSKKNSAIRKDAFAKPDKHKDAMRKAFRNAMQELRKAKKDQDVQDVGTDEQGPAVDVVSDDGAGDGVW
ncbi:hypothetical protein FNYG_07040 [Fusarium nygamai]|uniref:CCHC-type domain-containing protein n=1 Tax=Gibberella nygamai TaxID=42673 RepID=A0A2K0WBN4_GIBNY|nr:hypothetical protein FNYG_07040 [Fusarium nygamai]